MANLQSEEMAGSEDPRGARPAITPGRLEAIWPEANARLIRLARTKGADQQTAEDIAQEVAYRAMHTSVGFHDLEDFCAWANTVAKRLLIDHFRAQRRLVGLVELPERSDGCDVHVEVEKRIRLVKTLHELKKLDDEDREAIVGGVLGSPQPTRKAAVRLAVRRHRVRLRLLRIVEGVAAFWAFARGSRRLLVAAPATVAVYSMIALPAVIDHFDGSRPGFGTIKPPPGIIAGHVVSDGTPGTAGRGDAEQVALPAGAVAASRSGGAGTASGSRQGDRAIVPGPFDKPIVVEPSDPPESCTFYIGEPPKCFIPNDPREMIPKPPFDPEVIDPPVD